MFCGYALYVCFIFYFLFAEVKYGKQIGKKISTNISEGPRFFSTGRSRVTQFFLVQAYAQGAMAQKNASCQAKGLITRTVLELTFGLVTLRQWDFKN